MKNRKGIFEFVLGGSTDTKLLDVRVFDEATKRVVYAKQRSEAEKKEFLIVHCVQLETMLTRIKSGLLLIWMQTTSLRGAREAQQT